MLAIFYEYITSSKLTKHCVSFSVFQIHPFLNLQSRSVYRSLFSPANLYQHQSAKGKVGGIYRRTYQRGPHFHYTSRASTVTILSDTPSRQAMGSSRLTIHEQFTVERVFLLCHFSLVDIIRHHFCHLHVNESERHCFSNAPYLRVTSAQVPVPLSGVDAPASKGSEVLPLSRRRFLLPLSG